MGFIEAIRSFYGRYFDFETRSSRSEYWWVQLFYVIAIIVLMIPMLAIVGISGENASGGAALISVAPLIIFALAGIIPMIAVTVRRFHDQDKSGWMYLLSFIPYAGGIIIIIFMCLKGTDGDNRFGPDPLGDSLYDTFS